MPDPDALRRRDSKKNTDDSKPKSTGVAAGGEVGADSGGSGAFDYGALALHFMELINDDQVVDKLRKALFPHDLSEKIEQLTQRLDVMAQQLSIKDETITSLQSRVSNMEEQLDRQEQYTRRPNLRLHGIPENMNGEDTTKIALSIFNDADKMAMSPQITLEDLERTHRTGKKTNDDGNRLPRSIIVRFVREGLRDRVYRSRVKLKDYNNRSNTPVYINEDLTGLRARMLFDCRKLVKTKKIKECWSFMGNLYLKENSGTVINLDKVTQLEKY